MNLPVKNILGINRFYRGITMKKGKIALAVGLSLAVGLTGASLVACTSNEGGSSLSPYYLAGSSVGGLMKEVQDTGWYNGYTSNDNVPTGINFKPVDGEDNTYTLTAMLYTGDEFQILTIDKGWGGQMGYEVLDPDNEHLGLVEKPGGGTNSNFKVGEGKSGTYTLTLKFDEEGKNPKLSYSRTDEYTKLDVPVTKINLSKTTATLAPDAELELKATLDPDYSSRTVTWSSADDQIATVDANGKVKAKANGDVVITATVAAPADAEDEEDITATCTVKVSDNIVTATGVTLKEGTTAITEKTLHVGETVTVDATIAPADATMQTVEWKSESTVAEVTPNATNGNQAVVTAKKPGKVNVTATADEAVGTLEVTVAKDYYLRGDMMGWDPAVAELGKDNIIYFTEDDEHPGVYSTGSVKINYGHAFKIAVVGDEWEGQVGAEKCGNWDALGNYFDQVSDLGGDKFQCKDTAMYTFELDTTGDADVITVTWNSDLPDGIETATGLGAYGAATAWGWDGPSDAEKVNLTKGNDNKWTATLENVVLSAGEFQVRLVVDGNTTKYGDYGIGAGNITVPAGIQKSGGNNNIEVTAAGAGTYNITVTVSMLGDIEKIEIVAATPAA